MKKKIVVFLLLIAVMAGAAFAQPYQDGAGYKYYVSFDVYKDEKGNKVDNSIYRILRLRTASDFAIDLMANFRFARATYAGDSRIVEVLSVRPPDDKGFKKDRKQWKVGDKTTLDEIMKDDWNISQYRIRVPNGYFVEFGVWGLVKDRQFGVILPNSSVRVGGGTTMWVDTGAIGWDDDFEAAVNLDEFLQRLAERVNYKWLKGMVDPLKTWFARNDKAVCPMPTLPVNYNCGLCKGNIYDHIIISATAGAAGWGALWGLAPPWLIPAEFAKVQAQYTAQAYLAAAIGYCYDKFPKDGGPAFTRQLKLDYYVLFSGMDSETFGSDSVKGMGEGAATEIVAKATEKIMTKIAPRGLSVLPVIGTVWSVGKGAYDGAKEARDMGKRAVAYYGGKTMPVFTFEPTTGTITKYNGNDKNVKIPATISVNNRPAVAVKVIGPKAFENNKVIESVTLDSTDTREIQADAFKGCSSLKTVNIPKTQAPMRFGNNVFNGTSLTDATKAKMRELGYTGAGVGEASCTVVFMVPNGSPIQKTVDKNATVSLPPNPTKSGATFTGWNTQSDGRGTAFTASTRVTNNVSVYPQWREDSCTVVFMVPNGSPVQKTTPKNGTVSLPSNPTKSGFTFEGWNTKDDGSGSFFTASTRVTESISVYPKWKENPAKPAQPAAQPAKPAQPAAQPAKPAQPAAQPAQPAKKTYNIGDTGPNGGIVFAAGKECTGTDIGQVVWAEAANLAKSKGSGWRLPTKDELNAMYNNLKKSNKGGFKNESYWAANGNSAYAQNFGAGNDNNSPNVGEKKLVRAVRTF
jgi:uncharacterized repeat protein (TIGR02543 family)